MGNKIIYEKDYVTRFNLKTDTKFRSELIDLCLNDEMKIPDIKQCLAIGWSSVNVESGQYADFYNAVKLYVHSQHKRINPALNIPNNHKKGCELSMNFITVHSLLLQVQVYLIVVNCRYPTLLIYTLKS